MGGDEAYIAWLSIVRVRRVAEVDSPSPHTIYPSKRNFSVSHSRLDCVLAIAFTGRAVTDGHAKFQNNSYLFSFFLISSSDAEYVVSRHSVVITLFAVARGSPRFDSLFCLKSICHASWTMLMEVKESEKIERKFQNLCMYLINYYRIKATRSEWHLCRIMHAVPGLSRQSINNPGTAYIIPYDASTARILFLHADDNEIIGQQNRRLDGQSDLCHGNAAGSAIKVCCSHPI